MTLTVESGRDAPRECRRHLRVLHGYLGSSYDDVALVVTELVTNSVRHSGTSDSIDVEVAIDEQVRIEVSDRGQGFQPGGTDGRDPLGLGLGIVDRLASEWGVTRGDRFTVWAQIPVGTG